MMDRIKLLAEMASYGYYFQILSTGIYFNAPGEKVDFDNDVERALNQMITHFEEHHNELRKVFMESTTKT